MLSVKPNPGSSLTSRTEPFAGPSVVCNLFLRYCWVKPTRTMRSSGIPSPVLALVGTSAIVEAKSSRRMWSKRSVLKPKRENAPITV